MKYLLVIITTFLAFQAFAELTTNLASNSCDRAINSGVATSSGTVSNNDQVVNQAIPVGVPLSMLVWNIQKAKNQNWPQVYSEITVGSDFVVLQEGVDTESVCGLLDSDLNWSFANSWTSRKGVRNGVMTGSKVKPYKELMVESPKREFNFFTPKVSLFQYYNIEDSNESLLLVNVHILNFNLINAFKDHIRQITDIVREHKGPLMIVGDFNTWHRWKKQFLDEEFATFGIQEKKFKRYEWLLELDHIYYRGLEESSLFAEQLVVNGSDHFPIRFNFALKLNLGQ